MRLKMLVLVLDLQTKMHPLTFSGRKISVGFTIKLTSSNEDCEHYRRKDGDIGGRKIHEQSK